MKTKVIFLPEAISDQANIKNIYLNFIPAQARGFLLLKKKIARLKAYPCSCPVYEDDPDYRKLVVGDYLVFYTAVKKQNMLKFTGYYTVAVI